MSRINKCGRQFFQIGVAHLPSRSGRTPAQPYLDENEEFGEFEKQCENEFEEQDESEDMGMLM